jgi:hypothetical protein
MPLRQREKRSCLEVSKTRNGLGFQFLMAPEVGVTPRRFGARAHEFVESEKYADTPYCQHSQ